MDCVLRVRARTGQRTSAMTTVAGPFTGRAEQAAALHEQLVATRAGRPSPAGRGWAA
ncbi:hypothetical protein [Streptomyces lavenduligriseus]|uniref:Uncharacterized protein n=1 Tax=Streptomyces lavenduligriseus TaxID=67315 RepID=A0ABT0P352_9ACTN|nr:hypothetical protein [Streptomyces lavenduligriseus]MCL3998157.1 hypothetical protein [Streptomyces lavenduligriseus]